MEIHSYLVVVLAALLASAGVGAAATGPGSTGGVGGFADVTDPAAYAAGATYDDGTVTLTVTANGSGVAGLGVAADGTSVGVTDANGTASFAPAGDNGTLTVSGENVTAEFDYAVENGTVALDGEFEADAVDAGTANGTNETDETDETNETNEARGTPVRLPGPASSTAFAVQEVLRLFRTGELDANVSLGDAVSAVATGEKSPEHVRRPADAGRPDDAGPPAHANGAADANRTDDANATAGGPGNGTNADDRGPDGDRGKPAHAGDDRDGDGGSADADDANDDRKRGTGKAGGNGRGNGPNR